MLKVDINPENFKQKFVDFTKESFKSSFDITSYKWMFDRKVGKTESDIIVLSNEDEIIAGSGITYRQLMLPDKQVVDIAIMTSSWTLPAARGMGCFSKIIDLSKEIPLKKNVQCLTAFVTEENASYRRLKSAGAYLIPSYYLFSSLDLNFSKPDLNISIITNKEEYAVLFAKRNMMVKGDASFYYSNQSDFESQFINRCLKTEVLKVNNDFAIIEETGDIVKILLLTYENKLSFVENMKSLLQWCKFEKNKKLLYYTTDPELCDECKLLKFDVLNGYFTMLFSNDESSSQIIGEDGRSKIMINIQYGDKM